MIAHDAMYHRKCLTDLHYRASLCQQQDNPQNDERKLHGIAFGQVISFIVESVQNCTETVPVFKLSEMVKLYKEFLIELGSDCEQRIQSTRFKNRLLCHFEDMSAHSEGREVILAFN